jgi:hypothetical protein
MTGYESKKAAALDEDGMYLVHHTKRKDDDDDVQVYKRPWVELTKGEIESWDLPDNLTRVEFAWFVETKLREKNT